MPKYDSITILKMLLQEIDEDPKTFEENPMEFILDKYVSLNETLTELMTKDYREYLDAVFIVSPKPTSFKIALHNGQFFYLTYMGPVYEASVAGKNYYLSNVGEKERCMLAISKLLRGGNPLKTKGPEGAEQGAEAEEGGGEGQGATGGVGEETAGAGAGEEAPQLTESVTILNYLLVEQIKEARSSKLLDTLLSNIGGKKNSKRGIHLRGDFGSEQEVNALIASMMKRLKVKDSDYRISTIYPGGVDGSKSSTFNTYKIVINKETPIFDKGEEAYVVSRESGASSESYSLKPQELGISDNEMSKVDMVNVVLSGIKRNANLSKIQKKYLSQLITGKVSLSSKEKEEISQNKNFINQIEKNYGEVLGAVHMLNSNKKYKVQFPAEGNFPLVDFFLKNKKNTLSVSSKAASTSGNTIKIKNVLDMAEENSIEIEPKLKSILDSMSESSIIGMPTDVAEIIKDSNEIQDFKNKYIKSKSSKDLYNLESAVVKYMNSNYSKEMQELVSKAIGKIVYVKTKIKDDLSAEYIVKKPEALKFKLRSKNSQNRFKDRVGFDVK